MNRVARWGTGVLLVLLLTWTHIVQAQDATPTPGTVDLVVSLRDAQQAPVVGATILVRNADIDGVIGRVLTDADGTATLPIPATVQRIRVEASGQVASGAALHHQAADTGGIMFFPGPLGETRLDLVVTVAGVVLPDPHMWAQDPIPATGPTLLPFDPAQPVATPPGGLGRPPTPSGSVLVDTLPTLPPLVASPPPAPDERGASGIGIGGIGGIVLLLIAGGLLIGGIVRVVRRGR